jgi:REP element-mobilizing transposase RayT
MPRSLREDHAGAWHHVMNRGVNRATVFCNVHDRDLFLRCVATAGDRYSLQVHAYCLMSNHFHLLLRSEGGHLSDGMRFLSARFTQILNYRGGRDGPIFRGRFASVMIRSEAHLLCTSRYIHRNPVEAGLIAKPEEWPWSSAGAYLGVRPALTWLRTDTLLDMFGVAGRSGYRSFLDQPVDEPTRKVCEGM